MDIILNSQSEKPIYLQIFSQISTQILNGNLKSGMQLPPIRTIANELRISVIPVKMAWEELDRHGFIKTITGKGTFVASISSAELQQKASTQIEELAKEVVKKAKEINVSLEDLFDCCNKLEKWNNVPTKIYTFYKEFKILLLSWLLISISAFIWLSEIAWFFVSFTCFII